MNKSFPAFVLGLFDTGVAVLSGLLEHGVETLGFDHESFQLGFRLFPSLSHLCPSPTDKNEELISYLLAFADNYQQKPVLFPSSDVYVRFLSKNIEVLKSKFLIILSNKEINDLVLYKNSQYDCVKQTGTLVPQQMILLAKEPYPKLKPGLDYPVLMKPIQSDRWLKKVGKVAIIANQTELEHYHQQLKKYNYDVIIQEVIPGPSSNNYEVSHYITTSGKRYGPFIMQKFRQFPNYFGTGTSGESIKNQEIKDLADNLIQQLSIRGFANTEFKWDPIRGQYVFIETNLRVWQQIDFCKKCGLDLAWIQYLDVTDQLKDDLENDYKTNVGYIDLLYDIYAFLGLWGKNKLTFRLWLRSWKHVVSWGVLSFYGVSTLSKVRLFLSKSPFMIKFGLIQLSLRIRNFFSKQSNPDEISSGLDS
jgi:predicted ATP-grasp superfamily ATP-dependent carboligase